MYSGLVLRVKDQELTIRVAAVAGSLDLPAKSEFLCMIGHNGAYGCKDCLIKGKLNFSMKYS